MNVDEIRNFVNFIAKKNQSGSNPGPSEFNLALQRAYFEWVTQRCKQWQSNQKNTDDIQFLLEDRLFQPSNGIIKIPNGTSVLDSSGSLCPKYMHLSTLRSVYVYVENGINKQLEEKVDVVRDAEISGRLSSTFMAPSKQHPIASIRSGVIQIYPKETPFVRMTYLRNPKTPLWAFTVNSNGTLIYNDATSVQLESPDDTHNDVCMSILRYLGISIREQSLSQYAQAMKEEGL